MQCPCAEAMSQYFLAYYIMFYGQVGLIVFWERWTQKHWDLLMTRMTKKYLWEVRWMKMVKFTNVELDNKKTNNEPLLQLIASSFLLCVYSTDSVCHRTENICKKYHNFMVIIDVLKDNTSFWKLIFPPLTFSTNPSFLVFPHPTPSLISWLDTCLGVTSSIYW